MLRQAVFFLLLVEVSRASNILGQLSGTLSTNRVYQANTEITEFQADKAMQGFTHENGRLKVQKCGFYYIFAQVFFAPHSAAAQNRVALSVNGAAFGLMQAGLGGNAGYGTLFTGGVIHLHEGDYISLKTHYVSNLWVSRAHTFLGAYKIGE